MSPKILLAVFLFFCIGNLLFSQSQKISSSEISDEVFQKFSKDFPTAKNVSWEKKKGHVYHAFFMESGQQLSVYYDWLGILLLKEEIIKKEKLPLSTLSYLKQTYDFSEPQEIRKNEKGFIVTIEKKDAAKFEVEFDEDGNFLKELYESSH